VLVTRFLPWMFEIESIDSDNPVIPGRKALYFPESQVLIFTMPGPPHEIVSREIEFLLGSDFYICTKGKETRKQ
jgi:hypothetical protein